jgi:transcriptional regulator with XRE-family HTH domain
MQGLGNVIRRYRKTAGLSQVELAKRLKVDQTHISKIEQEERMPSVELLSQLAGLLHIPAAELMGQSGAEGVLGTELFLDPATYERELANITRGLNGQRRQKVLTYAQEQLKLMSLRRERTLSAE